MRPEPSRLLVVGPDGLSGRRVSFCAGDPAVASNAITFLTDFVTQATNGDHEARYPREVHVSPALSLSDTVGGT